MSIDRGNVRGLVRAIAYDAGGSRLGRVAQVFIDDRTDEPAWVAVDVTRTRGMRLLPLAGAGLKGRHLVIRAQRSTVRSAPRIDLGDGQLSSQDESRLLEHYGLTPAVGGAYAETPEHRPASPWPDDTERETAWERPAQQQGYVGQHTQAIAPGWEQPPADKPTAEQSSTDQSPAAGAAGAGAAAGTTGHHRDTAPTPVTPAPSPPPAHLTEPTTGVRPAEESSPLPTHPDPESDGSSPASPTR